MKRPTARAVRWCEWNAYDRSAGGPLIRLSFDCESKPGVNTMTMTERDNCLKALEFRSPKWIPVWPAILGAAWIEHREALEDIVLDHPRIFGKRERERSILTRCWPITGNMSAMPGDACGASSSLD